MPSVFVFQVGRTSSRARRSQSCVFILVSCLIIKQTTFYLKANFSSDIWQRSVWLFLFLNAGRAQSFLNPQQIDLTTRYWLFSWSLSLFHYCAKAILPCLCHSELVTCPFPPDVKALHNSAKLWSQNCVEFWSQPFKNSVSCCSHWLFWPSVCLPIIFFQLIVTKCCWI